MLNFHTITLPYCLLITLVLWSSTFAQNSPSPSTDEFKIGSNISELWRWNELELLGFRDIQCGAEDSQSNLWFAATGELLFFDGYKVKNYPFPKAFTESKTIDIHISRDGIMYVCTTDGLLQYLPTTNQWLVIEAFTVLEHWENQVIVESETGVLFVVTPSGLYRLQDKQEQKQKLFPGKPGRRYLAISKQYLWLSADANLYQFPLKNGDIENDSSPIIHTPANLSEGKANYRISANSSNDVFIFTYSKELPPLRYDNTTNQFVETDLFDEFAPANYWKAIHVGPNENDLLLLAHSLNLHRVNGQWHRLYIRSKRPMNQPYLFKRNNGNIIIGGAREKVYEIDCSNSTWERFKGLNFYCESQNGHYWFITFDGKIVEFDPSNSKWIHHSNKVIDSPLSIIESSNGYIWVSGSHQKTAAVSFFDGQKWEIDLHPQLSTRMGHSSALQLSNGDIIFGAGNESYKNGGVVIYHLNVDSNTIITNYNYYFPPTVPTRIEVIKEGKDGIYFGGRDLNRWRIGSDCEVVDLPIEDTRWIDTLESDPSGNIWVGTLPNYGIHKWNGNTWSTFSGEPFQNSGEVVHIASKPNANDLWVICRNDMLQYQISADSWLFKSIHEDLLFQRESGHLKYDRSGNLWINQSPRSWFFRVNPNYIMRENLRSNFRTTRYTQDVHPPIVEEVSAPIETTEPANVLIRWEGIDYYSQTPKVKLTFSYQINNNDWSDFTPKNELILDNLKSGDYEIKIRCRDLDGNISETAAATKFVVLPLLWKQPWFIVTVILVVLTIIALVFLAIYLRVHHILEIERFKNRFFMNMSHELRTPLTVILGPLESLKQSKLSPEQSEKIDLAHKNSQKMLSLVDELLDYRRLNHGLKERKYQHADIISFFREEVASIQPMFDKKHQSLEFICSTAHFEAWFESEKLEHIIDNLVTNACKYTPQGGNIRVEVTVEPDELEQGRSILTFSVTDDGPGIPKALQKKVFDPFFRVDSNEKIKESGTGLGLAFVKELTDSMQASLSLESPVEGGNIGTRISITTELPKTVKVEEKIRKFVNSDSNKSSLIKESATAPGKDTPNKTRVLLAEDDSDIRKFLSMELSPFYEIIEASNGEKGLEAAKKHVPDIVISDVLMPQMDGFSFCENLKNSAETSHIPVIMLTALKADQHELKALQKGADDFISKPVSIDILKQKIKNLLMLRNQLHKKYEIQKAQGKFDGAEITSTRGDEVFINKIIQVIEDSYQDPQFDVETIAGKMFMSRVTLYRKFKAITGESPSQFIKTVRMNKATKLLAESDHTVSEISDLVGYKEPGYFGTAFKSIFGETPLQYREKRIQK